MKLIKRLKLTSAIATISLFLFQTQYILAADVTVTTTQTTTVTATGTDTITINSGGSLSPTTGVGITSGGTGVDIINRGTILSTSDAIWGVNQGEVVAGGTPPGVTDLIDNYGTIQSTNGVGIRLGNPDHVITTLNNQSGATIQGTEKGVYSLFDNIVTLNNFGTIIGNDGRASSGIAFNDTTDNGVGIFYLGSSSGNQTINNSGRIFGNSKGIQTDFPLGTSIITINNSGVIEGGVSGIFNSTFFEMGGGYS